MSSKKPSPAKPRTPEAPVAEPRTPRQTRVLAGKIIGGAITGISFVTGIVAVIPIIFHDSSNFSSLTVDVTPYPANTTEWALPLTTDFSGYPASTGDVCDSDQRDWLASQGQQVSTRFLVDFHNSAPDGPLLTVKDFRVVGTREEKADDEILVLCNSAPVSGVSLQSARIDASSDANIAVYSPDAFGLGSQNLPDIPVAWNLAPGESGQLILDVASSRQFEGALNATVLSGTESKIVRLGGKSLKTFQAPALLGLGTIYLQAVGNLDCHEVVDGENTACDLGEVLQRRPAD